MTKPVVLLVVLLGIAQAAHVVELKERVRTQEESQKLLELLQLGEEDDDDEKHARPNVQLNSNFFGNIEVGDSKQDFEVVFDTGSSVLWVYSEKCSTCKGQKKHVFSPSKSHTFHKREQPFSIRYGTGESRGTTGTDQVYIANLEVEEQAFGQCEQPDDVMRSFPFDGIVGLSRALVKDPNAMPTIIKNIKEEKILEKKNLVNSFSFYIGREEGDPTYLIFGGGHDMLEETTSTKKHDLEESSKKTNIHYVSTLNKNIYWEIPLDDIFVHQPEKHHSGQPHHAFEQMPRIMSSSDSYATRGLDTEIALLEMDSELGMLEGKPPAKKMHAAMAHKGGKRLEQHHTITEATTHKTPTTAHKTPAKAHPTGSKQNPHPAATKKSTKSHDQKLEEAQLEEEKVSIKSHVHKATKMAANTKHTKTADDDEVGYGELVSNFKAPGASMNPCQQDDEHMCIVSVDSGHSLMSGPPDMIRSLKQKLSPPSSATSCTDEVMSTLPDLSFVMGGKMFTMKPVDYLIELQGRCVPALSERSVRNGHDWVLGEHFMRTYYTVFDYDNMRVGFSHLDLIKPHIDSIMGGKE